MDVLTLRANLLDLLSGLLGEYTLANGVTTPAIAVRSYGEALQPGTKVEGMECVIISDPDLEPVRQYKNERALQTWVLYLVRWGSGPDLHTAAGFILNAFPGTNATPVTVPQRIGPQHQMRVTIPDTALQLYVMEGGGRTFTVTGQDAGLLES